VKVTRFRDHATLQSKYLSRMVLKLRLHKQVLLEKPCEVIHFAVALHDAQDNKQEVASVRSKLQN